jgi:hypothetical protein
MKRFPISQIRGASAALDRHHTSVPYDATIRWYQVTSLVAPLMIDRAPDGPCHMRQKPQATTLCDDSMARDRRVGRVIPSCVLIMVG